MTSLSSAITSGMGPFDIKQHPLGGLLFILLALVLVAIIL
jgi:hypothetical protein